MTNNIRKYLEYSFFIFINFLYTAIGAALIFRLSGILSTKIIILLHNVNPITNDDSSRDLNLFLGGMGLCLLYLMVKPICFLILYKLKKQFPYIHLFFDRFRLDRKFMWKILGLALLFDIIFITICSIGYFLYNLYPSYFILFMQFFTFLGLIYNYLIFLLFFHPVKKDKIAEDGTITQGKIANIMTNIFIWADIILIIFVSLLTALIFIF